MCLYPKLIKNRKYQSNKKNGGVVPAITDKRAEWVSVGCGKCMECKKKKARDMQVRLHEEIRHNKNGKFVTFTFSNESIKKILNMKPNKNWYGFGGLEGYDLDNAIAKRAMRLFLERWRKKYGVSIRHWFATELGHNGTENIHMHGIVWTDETAETISKIWEYGYCWIGDEKNKGWVNEQTINYIVKYINKTDKKHENYNSIILSSPGIGKQYLERRDSERNKFKEKGTEETYVNRKGFKMALPLYYRNHLYNDEQKEKLWMEKLDKEVRYVNGVKIDVSKGEEDYYKELETARRKNKQLGYGDDEINWDKKFYENARRNMNYEKRLGGKDRQTD